MFKKFYSSVLYSLVFLLLAAQTTHAQWLTSKDEVGKIGNEDNSHYPSTPPEGGPADAMKWYYGQRAYGLGYIPKDALHTAWKQTAQMRNMQYGKGENVQSTAQWTLVGPNNIGGRVNAIAIHPTDPNTVYIGAANGGVWKTTNGGTAWTPLTDNTESLAMGSLAIDPENPNTIYAGTGELPASVDAYTGYGLFRSMDAGQTWSNIGPTDVAAYSRVIVNPKHSNIIYAAAGRSGGRVLRSTDGGTSWQSLTSDSLANGSVTDIALSMNGDVAVLYAAIATANGGIYRSDDGGDHWHHVNPPFNEMNRVQVDVDPTNWQNVVALSVNTASDLEGVYSSNDGGVTWTEIDQDLLNGQDIFSYSSSPPQGWYDVYVRVDPSDFNHILVGAISIWETHDGGMSWSDVAQSYKGGIHPDQHEAAFAPSNPSIVYVGNDGGVFSSTDGGTDYSQETFPIPVTEFYGIGIDQTQDDLTYGGTQDNGTLSGSSQVDWGSLAGGDGTYTLVDPNTPSRVYGANPQAYPFVVVNGRYSSISSGLNDSMAWLDPFAMDGAHNILYWGASILWYSTNQGSLWRKTSTKSFGSTSGGTSISAIDVFGDGETLLVGTGGGQTFVSTNNGKAWTDISKGLPGRWITWLKFSPSSKTTFYATVSGYGAGHVFKTTDNGAHWMNISSTLPDVPVNSLVMDPTNATALYIGTDVGVFFSPNDGGVWIPYGAGLPNVAAVFLDIQTANGILRAGTHGRSIWQVPIVNDIAGIASPVQRTVWVMGDTASIVWHGFGETVSIQISLDGGNTWSMIANGVTGTTYRLDSVNFPASENALVKISDGAQTLTSALYQIVQQKAGSEVTTIAEVPFYLYDIGYDADDNVLWGTNFGPGNTKIYKLDPDNGAVLDSVQLGAGHDNLTGIKYDPISKDLWVHQVITLSATSWSSNILEFTKTGTLVQSVVSPSQYATGILVRGDTIYDADRQVNYIYRALTSDFDFGAFNNLDFSDSRDAVLGPRCLAYDTKLNVLLLSYTDFQGTITSPTLDASYVLFLDPEDGHEIQAFTITEGASELTNIRGMEYDPRGTGNSAWITTLNSGSSAKLVKIALVNGPLYTQNPDSGQSAVKENGGIPTGYILGQNYPNPFSPETIVPYTLEEGDNVEIRLLDNLGRIVFSDSRYESAGPGERVLELSSVPAGNYIYELRVNGMRVDAKKMTLIK